MKPLVVVLQNWTFYPFLIFIVTRLEFSCFLGLRISFQVCSDHFSNLDTKLTHTLHVPGIHFPFPYLGLPLPYKQFVLQAPTYGTLYQFNFSVVIRCPHLRSYWKTISFTNNIDLFLLLMLSMLINCFVVSFSLLKTII